ncbi:MAG: hypothetical protein ACXWTH_12810 [Methylosarcina sp.]
MKAQMKQMKIMTAVLMAALSWPFFAQTLTVYPALGQTPSNKLQKS